MSTIQEKSYPGTYSIYKKSAAAQFTLMPPRKDENGRIAKNGAVLLEVASGSERQYNWSEKITLAIGMQDLCLWFGNPDSPPKLHHQAPNSAFLKQLEVIPGEGKYAGTFMLKISEKNNETNQFKNVTVPLTGGEYTVLLRLLMAAAPKMINWV